MAIGTTTAIVIGVASGVGVGAGGTYLLCRRAQKKRDEELKASMAAISSRLHSFGDRMNKVSSPDSSGGGASKAEVIKAAGGDANEMAAILDDLIAQQFTKPPKGKK